MACAARAVLAIDPDPVPYLACLIRTSRGGLGIDAMAYAVFDLFAVDIKTRMR